MSKITWKLIDPNIIEGGPDKIRNLLGGYYTITTSSTDGTNYTLSDAPSSAGRKVTYTDNEYIAFSYVKHLNIIPTASAELFVPNYSIPCLLVGNPNTFTNDAHWRSFVAGTTYDSASYPGIRTIGTMPAGGYSLEKPYDLLRLKQLVSGAYGNYISTNASYKYTYYNKKYEQKASVTRENLLPHFYLLSLAYSGDLSHLNHYLEEFVNLNDVVPLANYSTEAMFNVEETPLVPLVNTTDNTTINAKTDLYYDDQLNYRKYLDLFNSTTFSGSARDLTAARLQNVIFQENMLSKDGVNLSAIPWYAQVSWPSVSSDGAIGQLIKNNNLAPYILKMFKEHFVTQDNTPEQSFDSVVTAVRNVSGTIEDRSLLASQTMGYMDLIPSIIDRFQNSTHNRGDNFEFFTTEKIENEILRNEGNYYRGILNSRLMNLTKDCVDHLRQNYNLENELTDGSTNLSTLFSITEKHTSEPETIGYRISKISTQATTNQRNIVSISNSYVFNSSDLPVEDGEHHFFDTQLKYDKPYIYQVFRYVAVVGWNYQYTNYQISDKIGTHLNQNNETYECVQFTNIDTSLPIDDPRTIFTDDKLNIIYKPLSGSNPFAQNAQILTEHRHLLQMDYVLEPYIRIYEVPVLSKYVSITDHPPVAPEVIPYQKLDDSQRLGFFCKRESFVERSFPSVLNSEESTERERYLFSNTLYQTENITQKSTDPRFMEVYRILHKPTSYKDFDGSLIETVTLTGEDARFPYTTSIVEQKVATNTKYYYVFRFLNAHRRPGRFSPIIETELVSDGGYKYSVFDLYPEESVTSKTKINQPSKVFKKIFQLVPNPNQIIVNDSEVDYTQTAGSQINKISLGNANLQESIWNKKFKIRLVSKKTGKKLDINVNYKLERE
tara:strand:- start:896 stop:3565 length:2670 start_codon:yes stop_codon:yes gene_type:complete